MPEKSAQCQICSIYIPQKANNYLPISLTLTFLKQIVVVMLEISFWTKSDFHPNISEFGSAFGRNIVHGKSDF